MGCVSTSKRIIQSFSAFVILALLFGTISIVEVAAPPHGDICSLGIITSDSNIDITHATINMTIATEEGPFDYLQHNIRIDVWLEMTNTDTENESIQLLYSPHWQDWIPGQINSTDYNSSIDCTPLDFKIQILTNISHPRELPYPISNYFPGWVIGSDAIWDPPIIFMLTKFTLAGGENATFHFSDTIRWISGGLDLSVIEFCFRPEQLIADSTKIDFKMKVTDTWRFVRISPYPDDGVESLQEENEYVGIWTIGPPFSPEMLYNAVFDPITAGYAIHLVRNEYWPPTPFDTTTDSGLFTTQIIVVSICGFGVSSLIALIYLIRIRK